MSLVLNESLVLAKTRSQDLKSVLKLNCWGSELKDVSLVRQLVNVEVIGLSCNEITTLEDFAYCTKLKELILRKNKIKSISEVAHLTGLPKLTSLWLGENPCAENTHNYRKVVLRALPNLTILDNIPVTREELQEIEELGNEIYEEIPYESSNSSGSGPSSASAQQPNPPRNQQPSQQAEYETTTEGLTASQPEVNYTNNDPYSETSYFQPNDSVAHDITSNHHQSQLNNSQQFNTSMQLQRAPHNISRSSVLQHSQMRSQGSVTTLNGSQHNQVWSSNNNNNNNILPKGGKIRESNILSAVLCLLKELDYAGCEVVETALHCRMEETLQ